MNKAQINSLVLAYQNGDETAMANLFDFINPMIEQASREVEPYLDDFTKFDCRVVREIKRLMDNFEYGKHDFISGVKTQISLSKARFIRRDSRKNGNYVSMTTLEGDGGDDNLGFQFKSNSDVESEVAFTERVTELAQGDPRRETILLQWSKGSEDLAISELLAQLYGGKATGHRSFIKRFKTECRNILSYETV